MTGQLWAWIDLETTGLDPHRDSIIEIGCVLSDDQLTELGFWSSLVRPTPDGQNRMMALDPVLAMHTDSGLLADLTTEPDVPTVLTVDRDLTEWLTTLGAEDGSLVLAGSGVGHFDRQFIRAQMPQLDRLLTYWCVDVGVLRRTYRAWIDGDLLPDRGPVEHRALPDAYRALDEAAAFRSVFRSRLAVRA